MRENEQGEEEPPVTNPLCALCGQVALCSERKNYEVPLVDIAHMHMYNTHSNHSSRHVA